MNSEIIKQMTFTPTLELYNSAKSLIFPMFPIQVHITDRDGNVVQTKNILDPHLMQRVIVCKLLEHRHFANWSDMGTGKTLAAVMCAHAIDSQMNMIVCPNSVKEEWESHILGMFPGSLILNSIRETPPFANAGRTFFVVNYEQFQQTWSAQAVDGLVETGMQFLIFDEIHQAKHRDGKASERRNRLLDMRNRMQDKNPDLYVLGQTGTPCINDGLREPASLLELITGDDYSDLPAFPSIPNIFRVRQAMIVKSIRCPSIEKSDDPEIIQIDCSHRIDDIIESRHSLLAMERILLHEKIPFIIKNLKFRKDTGKGTIIYIHLVGQLADMLQVALREAGYIVDVYSGLESADTRSKVKQDFIHGNTDVLIASSPISTGVDGLQKICDTMIIPILPWTSAEFKQLQARIKRFGQLSPIVRFLIPQAFIEHDGQRWSIDEARWGKILFKQSLGDILTDGNIPPEAFLSVEKIKKACFKWLERIEAGMVRDGKRQKKIVSEDELDEKTKNFNFAEFHQMNTRFNRMHSKKASVEFQDLELFVKYHELYAHEIINWPFKPREIIAERCTPDDVIGDFGCGDKAHIADLLPDNIVHSFDHNNIDDERIFCCDIASVPLEDGQLDVAVFSLSLMGCNYLEYIQEAIRCLRPGGRLYIADLTEHRLSKTLEKTLKEFGLEVSVERRWKFTFFSGVKK